MGHCKSSLGQLQWDKTFVYGPSSSDHECVCCEGKAVRFRCGTRSKHAHVSVSAKAYLLVVRARRIWLCVMWTRDGSVLSYCERGEEVLSS